MTNVELKAMTIEELIELMATAVDEMLLLHDNKEKFKAKARQVQQIQNIILEKRLPIT